MLSIRQISKKYNSFHLRDISLDIKQGEYFVLTGPSGAGKSVLFEIIAGIIKADKGAVFLNESKITNLAIQKRKIGLVFQDNTLFPHLTVLQNLSYPLKIRKLNQNEITERVTKLAGEMGIVNILNRRPGTLSGGEIQRVSIARALSGDTKCLLLDEPLSSLDIQLKEEIRILLKKLHKEGLTILHITHDLREAFQLAERMAVMVNGQIIQCDKPLEICKAPVSKFVADFIGFRNFYSCKFIDHNQLLIAEQLTISVSRINGKSNFVIIPEQAIELIDIIENQSNDNVFSAVIREITNFPDTAELILDMGLLIYKTLQQPNSFTELLKPGMPVNISINSSKLIFLEL